MSRPKVEVCFSPSQYDSYGKDFEIVVAIDVLRATSAICSGIFNGVKEIIPVSTIEEAREYQNKGFIAAAERGGQIVEGFDFGNSPFSYQNTELIGKSVVLSTTNGTRAINIAAKDVDTIVIGALSNLDALVDWLKMQNKNTLLLCSGWKDKFNLEDTICAGAIAASLLESGKFISDEDSSIAAKYMYYSAKENYFGFLKASSHRRRLKKLNLNEDIKFCLTPNTTPVVPILKKGAIVSLDVYDEIKS